MSKRLYIAFSIIACAALVSSTAFGRGFGGFSGGGGGFQRGGYEGGGGGFQRGGFQGGGGENRGAGFSGAGGEFHGSSYGGGGEAYRGGYRAGGGEAGGYHAGSYGGSAGYAGGGYHATTGAHGAEVSRGQLGGFLGMPTDAGVHAVSGAVANPQAMAAGRAGAAGTVREGPGGTEVAHGVAGAQGVAAGPRGVAAGGKAVGGTAVKGPEGNVYYHGESVSRGAAAGPEGMVAGRQVKGGTGVKGAEGGAYYHGATAARGVAVGRGGEAAAGRVTRAGSPTYWHAQAAGVRGWYGAHPVFTPGWGESHAWAWRPYGYNSANWAAAAAVGCDWGTIGSWFGWGADVAPFSYDYGDNIVYQDNSVYYGSQPAGSTDEYYQEANDLAGSGEAEPDESAQWLPLGTFGLVPDGAKDPELVFQLAVDKDGIIRGNAYNPSDDSTVEVHGAVDKKNQRAAWRVGNQQLLVETGIYNLTENEATALVHNGSAQTQQELLVRLSSDSGGSSAENQDSGESENNGQSR